MQNSSDMQILFIGDFIRDAVFVNNNCQLIESLLQPILSHVFAGAKHIGFAELQQIFRSANPGFEAVEQDVWVENFNNPVLGSRFLEKLGAPKKKTIFIGFETPEYLYKPLVDQGYIFLDFNLHPYRFLDDFLFGIKTGTRAVRPLLAARAMDDVTIRMFVGLRRATIQRFFPPDIPEGSTLFVGQTDQDRSLIDVKTGKAITWEANARRVAAIVKQSSSSILRPHPFPGRSFVGFFGTHYPDLPFRYENIYGWLADPRIHHVVGLTSSALYEAEVFGKKVTFLGRRPLNTRDPRALDYLFPIEAKDVLSVGFWADFAQSLGLSHARGEQAIPAEKNRLRTTFNLFYGYNYLETDILLWESTVIQDMRREIDTLRRVKGEISADLETARDSIDFLRNEAANLWAANRDLTARIQALEEGAGILQGEAANLWAAHRETRDVMAGLDEARSALEGEAANLWAAHRETRDVMAGLDEARSALEGEAANLWAAHRETRDVIAGLDEARSALEGEAANLWAANRDVRAQVGQLQERNRKSWVARLKREPG